MKYLFLIPARGGSKGIPGKNVKEFAGKPLIAHAIGQALDIAEDHADVVVSTDSEQIADAARAAGAAVPFMRPAEFATDKAPTRDVIIHALDWMEARGRHYDAVVLLQTTSPLRIPDDIRRAVGIFESRPDADMVVAVAEAAANPYYDAFETDASGSLHVSKGDGSFTRRQDAPKVWQFTGSVYVMKTDSIRRLPLSKFPVILPCEVSSRRSVDLDTPTDWIIAETIYKALLAEAEKIYKASFGIAGD